jgi:hypothetical protein
MSRLPFGIVWDSDLWAWLIGDLLRKPMYQLGLGHSTPIPPCEVRLRVETGQLTLGLELDHTDGASISLFPWPGKL